MDGASSVGGRVRDAVAADLGKLSPARQKLPRGENGTTDAGEDGARGEEVPAMPLAGQNMDNTAVVNERPVTKTHLDTLFSKMRINVMGECETLVESTFKEMEGKVLGGDQDLIQEYDKAPKQKFQDIEADKAQLEARIKIQEQETKKIHESVAELQRALNMAQNTAVSSKDLFSGAEWDGEPDHSKLQVSVHENRRAIFEAVEIAIKAWMEDCNVQKESWKLHGGAIANSFTLQFTGSNGLGATTAKRCFDALRDESGPRTIWKELFVKDSSGNNVRLYIDRNKNRKTQRREQDGKRLFNAVKSVLATNNDNRVVHYLRREGAVTIDCIPFVRVDPQRDAVRSPLAWLTSATRSLGADTTAIKNAYDSGAGRKVGEKWESSI
jgi:hypothetical protein